MLLFLNVEIIAQSNRNYETNPDRKRTNIWFFGKEAGINFNTNPPSALTNGKLNTLEGSSSVCDTAGNLLFYTDGITVWNKNHDTMDNGYGLFGHSSSTQSALVIKHPQNDSLFYIFTTPWAPNYNEGLHLSIINIFLNNGYGKVIIKNTPLYGTSTEKLTAINHQNNQDIWIIGHSFIDNYYFSFLLNKDGINNCPIIYSAGTTLAIGSFEGNAQCYFKVSHNSKYAANCIPYMNGKIELFNFSDLTGKLELFKTLNLNFNPYGLEFSENDSNLFITGYINDTNYVCVFNVLKGTFRILNKFKLGQIQSIQLHGQTIYLTSNDSNSLKGIDNINSYSLANFNNSKNISINPLKKCSYGLPNFNQSYFYTPSIDFAYKYDCSNNQIKFEGRDTFYSTAQNWQIGKKGKPIEGNYFSKDIKHTFSDTGIYVVQYIAINGTRSDTIKKEIKIYPKINKYFLGKDTFYGQGTSINKTLVAPFGMQCYLWNKDSSKGNTFNADTAGVYVARITNQAFCVVTDTITITECINDLLIPSIYRNRDTLYTFHQLADSFMWFKNNQLLQVTKQPFIKLSDTGTYRVEAARKLHCNRSSSNFHISNLNVNINLAFDLGVKIYPNPADESITFEMQGTDGIKIRLYDAKGNLIYERYSKDLKTQMDISSLAQGLYVIELINEQTLYHSKILIQ